MKSTNVNRLKLKITQKNKLVFRASTAILITILGWTLFFSNTVTTTSAGTESLSSGSYIINMGVIPQTYSNGLKPYGMIYDLIVKYNVPIKWVIEPTKIKDGTDFIYNSIAYKGGPFIIPAEYIDATVSARIAYWESQGVKGLYITNAISVPVYSTLTNFPVIVIDNISNKQSIIMGYFANAMIPSVAYSLVAASSLNSCYDIWANPHADPTWTSHSALKTFVTVNKGYLWAQCHSVSVMESLTDPVVPTNQLNFLTTTGLQCYSNGKCGALASHGGNPTNPFTYNFPTSPVMQFMGTASDAMKNGSETWYIPVATGQWNSNTVRGISTSDALSPREGTLMAFGPAYNNSSNGMVMYEAGHDLTNGIIADQVAAQRAFFNFVLLAGYNRQLSISSSIPTSMSARSTYPLSVTATGGSTPYTYQWSSSVGGTFSSSTMSSTNFTAPNTSTPVSGVLKVTIIDACGRKNFVSVPVSFSPSTLPVTIINFSAETDINNDVVLNWTTASEINNNYFTLERSIDCKRFDSIGKVQGSFNSTSNISYSYKDKEPLTGMSYYRLRQVDYDGKYELFDPVWVKVSDKNLEKVLIQISPNPVHEYFVATVEVKRKMISNLQIVSLNGELLFSDKINLEPGKNNYLFDKTDLLKNGIYFITISEGNSVLVSIKIFKI